MDNIYDIKSSGDDGVMAIRSDHKIGNDFFSVYNSNRDSDSDSVFSTAYDGDSDRDNDSDSGSVYSGDDSDTDDDYDAGLEETRSFLYRHFAIGIVPNPMAGKPNMVFMKATLLHTKGEDNNPRM